MDRKNMRRFTGTDTYIVTPDLQVAVNAAIALERPLLVKGEPGSGKTILAHEVARAIARDLITWHIKSTTKAQQGLYEYDAVSRLRDGLGEMLMSWEIALRAEGKSKNTVKVYGDGVRAYLRWQEQAGVRGLTKEDAELSAAAKWPQRSNVAATKHSLQ